MGKRTTYLGAIVALVSILLAWRTLSPASDLPKPPKVQGRKNVVLFLVGSHEGLSNVHVATTFSLLQNHPEVEVHMASFAKRKAGLDHVVSFASSSARKPIFHELTSTVDYVDAIVANWNRSAADVVHPPGAAGVDYLTQDLGTYLTPWLPEEHFALYNEIRAVIEEVDPAVIGLDIVFWPAIDATRAANRLHAVISPNTITDYFNQEQPRAQVLWKYPVVGTGFDFPIPWSKIPENIFVMFKFAMGMTRNAHLANVQAFMREKAGLKDALNWFKVHEADQPWISQEMEGAALPVSVIPANVTRVGPIVVSVASAKEQDPEMEKWLAKRPTVLVNLGSSVRFTEAQAGIMAESLAALLGVRKDAQVLWKLKRWGDFGDEWMGPLAPFVAQGRVRLEKWLLVDPTAILESGHVLLTVNHGGGNVYHEAIKTGVPQVALPMWVDCYNYAALTEQIGVGVWASRKTAPHWSVEELTASLLKVGDGGAASVAIANKAKELSEKAKSLGEGRDHAAAIMAKLAASGR